MGLEQQLTIEEIKNIIKDIEESERKESNFNGKIIPLTYVQYYKDSFKGKNFTLLRKFQELKLPFSSLGFYDYDNSSIVVFIDKYSKIIDPNSQLFQLIKLCYHEIRHNIQDNLNPYCFTKFACDIDLLHMNYFYRDYDKRHDSFFHEIDADIYSISKTKEYLQNNYPSLYKKKEKRILFLESEFFTNFVLFDIVNSIEKTTYILRDSNCSFEDKEDISPVLNIFFNEDNSFKSIKEIINNKNFSNLNDKIMFAFLSSRSYLENLDIDDLDYEELELLNNALKHTCSIYIKQQSIIDEIKSDKKEKLKIYFDLDKSIFEKLEYLKVYLEEKVNFKLRQSKTSKKYRVHKKKIPEYLDKTSSLLESKKNNGFVVINILYIISLIISLGVIGYIILF